MYFLLTPIQIKIYSDRIWMWNPGNMPEEVKVKDLFKKLVSKPRNPNIANVFFKSGYVESWGRGYYTTSNWLAKKLIPSSLSQRPNLAGLRLNAEQATSIRNLQVNGI